MIAAPPPRRAQAAWLAALSLLAASCFDPQDLPTPAEVEAILESPMVNPEPHRSEIEAIDRLLLGNAEITEELRSSLCLCIARLRGGLAREDQTALVKRFCRELERFEAAAGRLPLGKRIEFTSMGREWQRIRGSLFPDAPWFEYRV